ncbi:MAG: LEA type 2 family protein [Deltaproteobacteria bacterium]|nr:LEA type 2 family protein [Deltaproteobacteria bacterium]
MKMKACLIPIMLMLASIFVWSLYPMTTAEAGPKATLKAPNILMIVCLPSFAGSESITLAPIFSISNPNKSLIKVSLDYLLEVGGKQIGKSQLPEAFIPPNGTIQINDAIVVPFRTWFAAEALSGKGPKEAILSIAPLWKGMGGLRPAPIINEETWEKTPANKAGMLATGSVVIQVDGRKEIFYFISEWRD